MHSYSEPTAMSKQPSANYNRHVQVNAAHRISHAFHNPPYKWSVPFMNAVLHVYMQCYIYKQNPMYYMEHYIYKCIYHIEYQAPTHYKSILQQN